VVCISRPSLWIEDGRLHREGGPAVRWPTGEQYFFHRGVELSEGGDKNAQMCGWLKDKFGLSWQIVPTILAQM